MRKKELAKELRKIEDFKNMDEDFKKGQKEKWQKEFARIEQRRTDLLLEHENIQKMSEKSERSLENRSTQNRKHQTKFNKRNAQARIEVEK